MAALAEAFIRVRADTDSVRKDVGSTFDRTGRQAGQTFSKGFTRDSTSRIRDSKGRYVKSGQEIGGAIGDGAAKRGDGIGKRMGGSIGVGLKRMVGPIAGILATVSVGQFFKEAVEGASDLSESSSKVGVVFGQAAGQVLKASQTSARAMGLSKQAYLEAAGTLGNLLVSLDIAPKKAAGMSQEMVKLAGDLASFNNTSPEEALDALRSGLVGETEPLKRFGVNMNEATLRTEAMRQGLVKNTKTALNPQQKALAAQALIMRQTKTAQGDFARTSGGLANQQRILAAQFDNVKAKIGRALLPALTTVVSFINSRLAGGGGLGGFFSGLGGAFDGLKAGFAVVRPALQWLAARILPQLAAGWADFKNGLAQAAPLFKVIGGILGGVLVAALGLLIAAFRSVGVLWKNVLGPVFGAIGRAVIWVVQQIRAHLPQAQAALGGLQAKAAAVASFFTVTLPAFFAAAGRAIAAPFLWLWRNVMIPVWHGIQLAVRPFVIWFKVQRIFLLAAIKAIGIAAKWLWRKAIAPAFRGIATVARWLWRNVFVPWGRGIKVMINLVAAAARWLWHKAIAPALRGIAAVARWLWHNVMAPVWRGIRAVMHGAWVFIRDRVFNPLKTFITKTMPAAFRNGRDLIGRYWKGLQNLAKRPVNFIINTVYNKGIRGFVGKIAKWVGQKNPLPYMKPLAAGGAVPAAQAGWRSRPTAVVGEGSRVHPEVVIPTDPKYRTRAVGLWQEAGTQLLARGGKLVAFGRALQRKGWRVSEHPAFGGVAPVHSRGSWHYRRGAIDVNWAAGQSPREMAKIDQLIRSGVARAVYGLRSIYRYPNHYNHAHFDIGSGPDLGMRQGKGGGGIPGLGGIFNPLGMLKKALSGPLKTLTEKFGNNPYVRMLAAVPRKLMGSIVDKAKSLLGSIFSAGGGPVGGGGPVRDVVRRAAARHGWGSGRQWNALSWLIQHESSWNPRAQNPTSSAYGLFQFLDSTWGTVGGRKTSNPALQALYGLRYIKQRYGSPLGAKGFWQGHHWYEKGSWNVPATGPAVVHKGEMIFPRPVADAIRKGGGGGLAARPIEIHLHADSPSAFDERTVRRGVLSAMQTIDVLYGQGV